MRILVVALSSFFVLAGCGAQPGSVPEVFATDTTLDSGSQSVDDTTSNSGVDTGSTSIIPDTTATDTSATDTTEASDSVSVSASTEETVNETASQSSTANDTGSGSDTASNTSTLSTDTGTSSETGSESDIPPSPCELLALRDTRLVCCGQSAPDACDVNDWAFSSKSSTYGCCSADLDSYLFCDHGTTFVEETCDFSCGASGKSLGCVVNSCQSPYAVTEYPFVLAGDFNDYGGTFSPTDYQSCGDGGGSEDVWFLVRVPPRSTVGVAEMTPANTTLRLVSDCTATSCLEKAEQPETLALTNDSGEAKVFLVILSDATTSSQSTFTVIFSLQLH